MKTDAKQVDKRRYVQTSNIFNRYILSLRVYHTLESEKRYRFDLVRKLM